MELLSFLYQKDIFRFSRESFLILKQIINKPIILNLHYHIESRGPVNPLKTI